MKFIEKAQKIEWVDKYNGNYQCMKLSTLKQRKLFRNLYELISQREYKSVSILFPYLIKNLDSTSQSYSE